MIDNWKEKIYWNLPVALQEIALSFYARYLDNLYYNSIYEKSKHWVKSWQSYPISKIEELINRRLQFIIQLSANNVPYYRKNWKKFEWQKVQSKTDLALLPILDKQSIRQNERAFIADGLNPKKLWLEKTSGTTGTSLKIYWPKEMLPKWWAITEVMCRHIAGVSQEMPRAMVGGRPVVPGETNNPPYWRFNKRWRQLYFSSYHISNKTAPEYVEALRTYRSLWMTGYGSAIATLAESALKAGVTPYTLHSVIVSGDTLLYGMRRSIEKFFQCKCFDHYGQCEGVAMAMECVHGRMHIIPMVGIIEILRADGSACKVGETGEIVATSLLNEAMPLIRYRIGDYAALSKKQECECGNPNPMIESLEGRTDDYLITADNRKIGRLSTAMKKSPNIHSCQIVQNKPGRAFLLVKPGEGYRSLDAAVIRDDIIQRIGKFKLQIIEVEEIPKTQGGKTNLVVRFKENSAMQKVYSHILDSNFTYF